MLFEVRMTQYTYQERFRTEKGVFDEFTKRNLFYLSSRGFFDELKSPIFVGKESNVFSAIKDDKLVIVKIYRVQNADFKKMYDYIGKDTRYEHLKKKRREIIFAWTQREFKNLHKAEKAKVNSPRVIAVKNNVLVEEFIGDDEPAPQLKNAYPQDPEKFLKALVKDLKKLYKEGLVHGDLSSFNILNYKDKPVIIDYSQSTVTKSSNAQELMERDLGNVARFFKKLGVQTSKEALVKKIVG